MQPHPIYINLFGTGLRYWQCEIPLELFEEMQQFRLARNEQWENLLFDFGFLERFGYKHWSDLSTEKEHVGLLVDPMNKIEIKQAQRIISRFQASELTGDDTLFQLHNTAITTFTFQKKEDVKQFVLVHFEKGLIGKFQLDNHPFDVQNLSYEVKQLNKLHFLAEISYQNELLRNRRTDSVTVSSLIIWS